MTFLVQLRRREIGVRLALGGSPRNVTSLMTGRGMRWTAIGLAIGSGGGFAASFLLSRFLYNVSLQQPAAFLITPFILGSAAYLACYVPARRATRLDPLSTLREE
jgi:putative ABC transport system permease protein